MECIPAYAEDFIQTIKMKRGGGGSRTAQKKNSARTSPKRGSPSTDGVQPQLVRLKTIEKQLEDLIRKNDAAGDAQEKKVESGGVEGRITNILKNDKETKYNRLTKRARTGGNAEGGSTTDKRSGCGREKQRGWK